MTDPLTALENWAAPLLSKLTTTERRALARTVGQTLRRGQASRISSQRNPDGTAYEPRKTTAARAQKGRIRRTMFEKLRAARLLRATADADGVTVAFVGRTTRIARVHHHGLRDQVKPGGPMHQYAARRLLGFSDTDRELIMDLLLQHLTP